ncbi:CS1-pili formation C-terminal domain-containing protein, partial [Chromobacterium amazonense]|uniref:CS1-pili formation C-terminal domain-containing protein n=1 Tax=Chromobacterium amazonense TaxID=1382803 RepID=UPI00237DE3C0
KVMLGGGMVRSGSRSEYAATVDAELNERMRLDSGLFWRDGDKGWHGQLLRTLADDKGSWQLGLEQQWRRSGEARHALTATAYRQLNERNSVTLQARHAARSGSVGVDLGLNRRQNWLGQEVDLRFSLFDQPGTSGQARRRGVEAALNLHLGESERQYHASVGSRAKEGRQQAYATAGMSQSWQDGALRKARLGAEGNEQGLGFSGSAGFHHQLVDGDAFFSRGANRIWTGSLNLRNTVALGAGKAALGVVEAGNMAMMIVEVESDDPDVTLKGGGRWGEQTLRPGVNLLPLTPYQPGRVSFMLAQAEEVQSLSVSPSGSSYQLNRGGVAYQKVKVMRVMTVIGRLLGQSGQPWAGASVVNHAGRTISDENGLFTLDVHVYTPELELESQGIKYCSLLFQPGELERTDDIVFIGDIGCDSRQSIGSV